MAQKAVVENTEFKFGMETMVYTYMKQKYVFIVSSHRLMKNKV